MRQAGSSLPSADPTRDGEVLRSGRFDDIYFSRAGGPAEKRHVFLAGCGLPEGWRDASLFTVAELGFGAGLNFLVTWEAWRRTHPPNGRLHYLAVEGFPLSTRVLADGVAQWPELQSVAVALAQAYPEPQRGFHRIDLDTAGAPVVLTLLFGDVLEMLGALEASVDAWYLDGFAPDRNPAMWAPEVMREIARLSRGGARPTQLATYSAAGDVRRSLDAAGFAIARSAGFGAKREMLRGRFRADKAPAAALPPWFAPAPPRARGHAAVVGAGLAGANVGYALGRRGWNVTLLDRHAAPAMETSGNPVGVLLPRLTAADGIEGRVHAAAWRYTLRMLEELSAAGHELRRNPCGVLRIAQDEGDARRLATIAERGVLPDPYLFFLEADEASEVACCEIPRPALYFPQGGTLAPQVLCQALSHGIRFQQAEIADFRSTSAGVDLLDRAGTTCCSADVAIFANALGATRLHIGLPLTARRGQITLVAPTAASANLRTVIAADATIAPALQGHHYVGATFDWTEDTGFPQSVRAEDHARNLALACASIPGLLDDVDAGSAEGRAALRCMTPDHLPVSGPLPDRTAYLTDYASLRHGQSWVRTPPARYVPGVYVLTGLGARGLVTAPLAAEVLACHITGEPWPLARDLVTALHPARFLLRDLKRTQI